MITTTGGCEAPTPKPAPTFTPYFRTGGTDNFKWHRAAACLTREAAIAAVASLRRAGHAALYQETALLDSIGLPETFDALHGTGWW